MFPGGVVHSASYVGQAVPPGGIISIFGKNLAQAGAASSTPLPTTLGGTTFTAAGRDLPLFFSSSGQVNAQLPAELSANSSVALVAKTKIGGTGNVTLTVPLTVQVGAAVPGIFSTSQDGKGQGVILDPMNRLVDGQQTTATAGDVVVIYCTGLGVTTPPVISGTPSPSPAAQVIPAPEVRIGGQPATVQFAGLTPTLVGLYQVNVVIPAGIAVGPAVPVVITQGGVSSNTVTLAVR